MTGRRGATWVAALTAIVCGVAARGQSDPAPHPPDADAPPRQWQTPAERSAYRETGGYDDVVAFCRKLAAFSAHADYQSFGRSAQGRRLPLLVLSAEGDFSAHTARNHGKLVVLLQNCIHPGECAGKEASLALARDIAATGARDELLRHVNLLIMPIFNVDGHERMSAYNRVNQNGPNAMGWRVTSTNLNLNRDYMKADTIEMRQWLRLWDRWRPDLLIDNHTTDGGDHRYVLLYASAIHQDTDPAIAGWVTKTLYPQILPRLAAGGHLVMPYFYLRDRGDPVKGIDGPGSFTPRFSTGYAGLCNRPSILVEAHALKPFKDRVRSTYDLMLHTLEALNRDPESLRAAIREADARTTATRGGGVTGRVPLRLARTGALEPFVFKAVKTTKRNSDVTGGEILTYGSEPVDIATHYGDAMRVERDVAPPFAYIVPREWDQVGRVLALHGLTYFQLNDAQTIAVESYRFDNVTFASRPYEGRQQATFDVLPITQTRTFPPGTVVVPLDQPGAKVAVHLLEPAAPDSLAAWGFFNAMFEQKEYAESYRFEPIAQTMLQADPELKAAFDRKLRDGAEFAADPRKRLNFFYRRSPYWDPQHNVYPVGRLTDPQVLRALRKP